MPNDLLELDHVGIAVADLTAAVAFHTEVLGLRVELTETNDEQHVTEVMLTPAEGGTRIQLLEPTDPASAIAQFLQRSGPGLHHIAYRVADVVATTARLQAEGRRVLYPHPRHGTAGSLINFVHPRDTGGVLLELVQPRSLDRPG
ncbi:methylmalonyl-CoA epimerase [Microlunatus sp. Y2014]|uniref:methylmalonyl-CoA epimerase n=1 Tax=Microlunatus sp. Y2014 TaxID=3418488 RepID=UPI003DA6E92E